jgi:hypothetical protein
VAPVDHQLDHGVGRIGEITGDELELRGDAVVALRLRGVDREHHAGAQGRVADLLRGVELEAPERAAGSERVAGEAAVLDVEVGPRQVQPQRAGLDALG